MFYINSKVEVTVKNFNQFYNYSTVLGAVFKCKPYSKITVEIGTQLKTVKITLNIFEVLCMYNILKQLKCKWEQTNRMYRNLQEQVVWAFDDFLFWHLEYQVTFFLLSRWLRCGLSRIYLEMQFFLTYVDVSTLNNLTKFFLTHKKTFWIQLNIIQLWLASLICQNCHESSKRCNSSSDSW